MTIFSKLKKKIKSDVSFFSEARPFLVALLSSLVVVLALAMSFVLALLLQEDAFCLGVRLRRDPSAD